MDKTITGLGPEGIDHELVKNTPNAARIGHEITEIRDDSRDLLSR